MPATKLKLFLLLVFIVAFLVRLYHVTTPIADWHSHRQADTASVSRNIYEGKGTFFVPTFQDISNVQSGKDNPFGYRMVELPIYNQLVATLTVLFSAFWSLETISRLVNIFLWLITGLLLYQYTKNKFGNHPALYTLVTFLFLPFGIYYSRTTLPEPLAVFLLVSTLYFLNKKQLLFSALCFGLGLSIKPYLALLLFFILLYEFFQSKNKLHFFIFFLSLGLLPFISWRVWISHFPEGIPTYKWLFQQGFSGESFVVGRPYWFRWLFYERIGFLISGLFLLPALLLSLQKKYSLLLLLGILTYFSVIARGNVQHDYYQVLTLPFISILIGLGLAKLPRYISITLLVLGIIISGNKIKEYYKINNPIIIEAGERANKILPPNAYVIAPYTGDTAFLYATHHSGWPVELYDLDKNLENYSSVYLVSVNYDNYTNSLLQKYPVVEKNDKYVIAKIK